MESASHGGPKVSEIEAQRILVVDDSEPIRGLLSQVLSDEGHNVSVAADGEEALAAIERRPPDLILLDLDLPGCSGYEICRRLKKDPATRLIPIVIITGQSASEIKVQTWELGADDFLPKPFRCAEVIVRCRSLLRVKRLLDELDSAEAVVFGLARTMEAKSSYTFGHSERVADYATLLAERAGAAREDVQMLHKGALLHDIGKISVPDAILNKAGPLTPEEMVIVQQHTVQGAHIVEPLRSIRRLIPLVRWHHERIDGQGYPDGLHGEQIPWLVRILSVADVYDSLSSRRPYRPPIPQERCLEILREDALGGGLDPELVQIFCQIWRHQSRHTYSVGRQTVSV
jgi:putative two-component system response regulator